jgi:hypothetical protein
MAERELTVAITEFDPERRLIRGHGEDGTGYVMHLQAADAEKLLASLTDRGRCPRCDFENSVADVVYAGNFICDHYPADQPWRLSETEMLIVDACRSWLADDAIERCLEDTDEQRD